MVPMGSARRHLLIQHDKGDNSVNLFDTIDKIIEGFTKLLSGIAGIMMGVMAAFVFADVSCRYVFKAPVVICNEMTNILFPWIVALSAVSIAKNYGNTALTFIKEKFKGPFRHFIEIFGHVVMLYYSVMMTSASWNLCYKLRREIMALTRISKAFVYGSMLVCFVGITIVTAWNLVKYIRANYAEMMGGKKA